MGRSRPLSGFIIHVRGCSPDPDGFHSPSLPEPCSSPLDCGTFPVDSVVSLLDMDCNAILGSPLFLLSCARSA